MRSYCISFAEVIPACTEKSTYSDRMIVCIKSRSNFKTSVSGRNNNINNIIDYDLVYINILAYIAGLFFCKIRCNKKMHSFL